MESRDAARELEFIQGVIQRTRRRIDPHAFHFVHWGLIVLVWYPLANYFQNSGREWWQLPLGIGALVLGMVLSGVREARLARSPRMEGEDTFISRQICSIVYPLLAVGILLSAAGPALGFIEGPRVPIVWGFIYANMAFMVGVIYSSDFRVSGVVIFAGTIVAMIVPEYCGYILGPFMGFGMIVPGMRAERRVVRLLDEKEPDLAGV